MLEHLTTETILAAIDHDLDAAIAAVQQRLLPTAVLKELLAAAETAVDVQVFLVNYADIPSRFLEQMAHDCEEERVLEAIARHSRTPKVTLQELAANPRSQVRILVAANREISPRVAETLATDTVLQVRLALAENPAISGRIQEILHKDPQALVRGALLKQKRLDNDLLARLGTDTDLLVRLKAILYRDVNPDLMLAWADSDDRMSQLFLLQRPDLPAKILESLCFSVHADVQQQAIQRKDLSADEMFGWSNHDATAIRVLVAGKHALPTAVQQVMLNDSCVEVRQALAANSCLGTRIADGLSADPELSVRLALAQNPAISAELVRKLCQQPDMVMHKLLLQRGDLQPEHLQLLIAQADDNLFFHLAVSGYQLPALPESTIRRLAGHRLPTLRALAAANAGVIDDILGRLSTDPAAVVRRGLAQNPNVPKPILRFLASDAVAEIAVQAQQRLTELQNQVCDIAPDDCQSEPGKPGLLQRLLAKVRT